MSKETASKATSTRDVMTRGRGMVAVVAVAAVVGVTVGMREVVLGMREIGLVVGVREVAKVEGEVVVSVVVIVVEVEMGVEMGMGVDVVKTVEPLIDCSLLHGEQK